VSAEPKPQEQAPVQLTYRDRPEIPETYADTLHVAIVEGAVVKIEFVVNRPHEPTAPGAFVTGNALTACRLVMPLQGVVDMANRLDKLLTQLHAKGILKSVAQGSVTVN
jgi:hypothetical protein